jgi:hypothetical protein
MLKTYHSAGRKGAARRIEAWPAASWPTGLLRERTRKPSPHQRSIKINVAMDTLRTRCVGAILVRR